MCVCDGRISNQAFCTNGGGCSAQDLLLAYLQAPERERPARWCGLLAAHGGHFVGACPGSALVSPTEPCDMGAECLAAEERRALLAWEAEGRPGLPLPWLAFRAAHGDRLHHPDSKPWVGGSNAS